MNRILRLLFLLIISTSTLTSFLASNELPQRIISLAPANTEILYALNLADKVVGVSSYCNYPPQAQEKEKVGDFSNPNIEKIASLKPDLILATGLEQDPAVKRLKKLGFNVEVIDPQNFNELFDSITRIGELTGTETYAFLLNQSMKSRIGKLMQTITAKVTKPPKIFVEISLQPLMTASSRTFMDEMINMLRAINIAGNLPRPYCRISEEFVIKQDPDCIILTSPQAKAFFTAKKAWQQVQAVKNNKLIDTVNPDLLMRPGPRLVDGLEQLAEKIYNIKVQR